MFLASVSSALFLLAGPISGGFALTVVLVVAVVGVGPATVAGVVLTTGITLVGATLVTVAVPLGKLGRLAGCAVAVIAALLTRLDEVAEATVTTELGDDTSAVRRTGLPVAGSTVATGAPVMVVDVSRAARDRAPVPTRKVCTCVRTE